MKYLILLFLIPTQVSAGILYDQRSMFEDTADNFIVDDYQNEGYMHGDKGDHLINDWFTDIGISSVLNETQYHTTGHVDSNATAIYWSYSPNRFYCGGCNGSFNLDFTGASIEVNAVGIDIASNYSQLRYNAYVTYGDGSTENFLLPLEEENKENTVFWGVSHISGITDIHFGGENGQAVTAGSFAIDNLTIGGDQRIAARAAVPEPSIIWLFLAGLSGIGLLVQAKRYV